MSGIGECHRKSYMDGGDVVVGVSVLYKEVEEQCPEEEWLGHQRPFLFYKRI